MKQKLRDQIRSLSKTKRARMCLLMGFLIGLLTYAFCLFFRNLSTSSYAWILVFMYPTAFSFVAFCPILAFFVTYCLELDLWAAVYFYFGAFLAYVPFHFSIIGICIGVLMAFVGSVLGAFSYRGRADGWGGWKYRVLALSPTIVATLFLLGDEYSFWVKLCILGLAFIIHYRLREKLVFRIRNLIILGIYTFLSSTYFFSIMLYGAYFLLNPGYYP